VTPCARGATIPEAVPGRQERRRVWAACCRGCDPGDGISGPEAVWAPTVRALWRAARGHRSCTTRAMGRASYVLVVGSVLSGRRVARARAPARAAGTTRVARCAPPWHRPRVRRAGAPRGRGLGGGTPLLCAARVPARVVRRRPAHAPRGRIRGGVAGRRGARPRPGRLRGPEINEASASVSGGWLARPWTPPWRPGLRRAAHVRVPAARHRPHAGARRPGEISPTTSTGRAAMTSRPGCARPLDSHGVAHTLSSLAPSHAQYTGLQQALARYRATSQDGPGSRRGPRVAHPAARDEHGAVALGAARARRAAHPRQRRRLRAAGRGGLSAGARHARGGGRAGQPHAALQRRDDLRGLQPLLEHPRVDSCGRRRSRRSPRTGASWRARASRPCA